MTKETDIDICSMLEDRANEWEREVWLQYNPGCIHPDDCEDSGTYHYEGPRDPVMG